MPEGVHMTCVTFAGQPVNPLPPDTADVHDKGPCLIDNGVLPHNQIRHGDSKVDSIGQGSDPYVNYKLYPETRS